VAPYPQPSERVLAEALRSAAMGRSGADALAAIARAHRACAQEHAGRHTPSARALAASAPKPAHRTS